MNRELIEYFWDERSGVAEFIYEDDKTGELTQRLENRPMARPDLSDDQVYEATKTDYFVNLQFWLATQPLYD